MGSHFWPNQLSAAGVGEKDGIPEVLSEVDPDRDVTSALLKLGAFKIHYLSRNLGKRLPENLPLTSPNSLK